MKRLVQTQTEESKLSRLDHESIKACLTQPGLIGPIHIHIPLKYDVLMMEPYLFSMVRFGSLRYFKMGHLSCGLDSHLDKTGQKEDVNALHDEKGG